MSGIRSEFKFTRDYPRPAEAERFHLFLYFTDKTIMPPAPDKRHSTWTISDTEFAVAGDRGALVAERRAREEEKFEQMVLREMAASRTRLVRGTSGLERVAA